MGLQVEPEHKLSRMAGTLQNMFGDNKTVVGKIIKADAAVCDMILAPVTTAIDIISGANDEDAPDEYKDGKYGDGTPHRITGATSRMFKNTHWSLQGCAAVVDVVLSPIGMLIDTLRGANQDRSK